MSQRKEPTVSSVLSSKEELMDRRTRSTRQTRPSSSAPPARAPEQRSSSGFVWFTFFIALLASSAVGYTFWQLQQAQAVMAQQSERIVQLEDKLALSDDSASQSLTALAAKVRELDINVGTSESEIRKLWDARKKTRKTVAEHDKSLKQATKSVKDATQKVASLGKEVQTLEKSVESIDAVKKSVASLSQSTSDQDILLQSVRERVSGQTQSLKQLKDQVTSAATSSQLNSVDQRVKNNEEAVKSFDAFRRTVNRDLLQLKQAK